MLNNLLWHKVNVLRPTPTKDSSGGEVDTYATVYSNQPCQVQPVTASWQIQYAARKIDISHSAYLSGNVVVRNGDKIVFGTRQFLVKGFRNLVELGRVLVVDCQELT